MAPAPIEYGPRVQADDEGISAARGAVEQQGSQTFALARQLGENIEGGAKAITQGILHSQAVNATAAVKERQAKTLQFIESNPYVSKQALREQMTPEDYDAWHVKLEPQYQNAPSVPMHQVAGDLYESNSRQAREQAGDLISLPGWRAEWLDTERVESATVRERYVNRLAAQQLVADNRYQAIANIDNFINRGNFKEAESTAKTTMWLSPEERKVYTAKALAAKEAFPIKEAIRTGDVEEMGRQLERLQSKDAPAEFPNTSEDKRTEMTLQLERVYGYHAARRAASDIVKKYIDEDGRVDAAGIGKEFRAYDKPNREEVDRAIKLMEDEAKAVFRARNSDIQAKIHTAGQDPKNAVFSYDRAMQAPGVADLAATLNRDAPEMLTALHNIDERMKSQQRAGTTRQRDPLILASKRNLDEANSWLYDERHASELKSMTPAQWQTMLLDEKMFPSGFQPEQHTAAMKAFETAQKDATAVSERISTAITAGIGELAKGSPKNADKLRAKYDTALTKAAHAWLRQNAGLPPDKMSDGLREFVRKELIMGTVKGSGRLIDDDARRIDWETNPKYRGKPFVTSTGEVVQPRDTRPQRTINGVTKFWDGKAWVE